MLLVKISRDYPFYLNRSFIDIIKDQGGKIEVAKVVQYNREALYVLLLPVSSGAPKGIPLEQAVTNYDVPAPMRVFRSFARMLGLDLGFWAVSQ